MILWQCQESLLPHVQSAGVHPIIRLDIKLKADHLLTQLTLNLPPAQACFTLKQPSISLAPSRKALRLPEVVDAIRAECDAMPPACSQWTIEVHDKLLAKFFRQLMVRHATGIPGLPRKPWVTTEVSKRLVAHAAARHMFRATLRELCLARLRVLVVAWAVCPRSRPRAMHPFPRRRCPLRLPWPLPHLSRLHPAISTALLHRIQMWQPGRPSFCGTLLVQQEHNASWHIGTGRWLAPMNA